MSQNRQSDTGVIPSSEAAARPRPRARRRARRRTFLGDQPDPLPGVDVGDVVVGPLAGGRQLRPACSSPASSSSCPVQRSAELVRQGPSAELRRPRIRWAMSKTRPYTVSVSRAARTRALAAGLFSASGQASSAVPSPRSGGARGQHRREPAGGDDPARSEHRHADRVEHALQQRQGGDACRGRGRRPRRRGPRSRPRPGRRPPAPVHLARPAWRR